jgi:hypothetical protein
MGETKAFLWIASSIAFVVLSVDQTYKNQQIQSRASQQQQPSAQITKATIDSGFNGVEDFLKKPASRCVIEGRVENNKNHDRACKNFIFVMSVLDSLSHQ